MSDKRNSISLLLVVVVLLVVIAVMGSTDRVAAQRGNLEPDGQVAVALVVSDHPQGGKILLRMWSNGAVQCFNGGDHKGHPPGWGPVESVGTYAFRSALRMVTDEEIQQGEWELVFHVGAYFSAQNIETTDIPFLDQVPVRFGIDSIAALYHVPLLVSPWSYTTYRGS